MSRDRINEQNDIDRARRERAAVTADKSPSQLAPCSQPTGKHYRRTRRDFNQQSQPDASWLPEHHGPLSGQGVAP